MIIRIPNLPLISSYLRQEGKACKTDERNIHDSYMACVLYGS